MEPKYDARMDPQHYREWMHSIDPEFESTDSEEGEGEGDDDSDGDGAGSDADDGNNGDSENDSDLKEGDAGSWHTNSDEDNNDSDGEWKTLRELRYYCWAEACENTHSLQNYNQYNDEV